MNKNGILNSEPSQNVKNTGYVQKKTSSHILRKKASDEDADRDIFLSKFN
jgi:hypothetical protein